MKRTLKTLAVIGMLAAAGTMTALHIRAETAQKTSGKTVPSTLDGLLAPVALYPDQLLAHILVCAGNPAKVTELGAFLKTNSKMKGTQLQNAAVKAGFDPSCVALVLFPDVVNRMAAELEWTTTLGQAFVANKSAVFDSIQKLRAQAQKVGTLKDTPQQNVESQTTPAGEQVIVIEPTNPQIVYVPQYNSTTVYTTAPTTTTVVVQDDDDDADAAVAAGLIGFTAGIALGAAIDNDYYYGPYGWHGGAYMYNDGWDDYWDHREDAREDWMDHREDIVEERGDRAESRREDMGDRQGTSQQQRTERQQTRQEKGTTAGQQRTGTQSATAQSSSGRSSYEARGYAEGKGQSVQQRSGTSSNAFSGYSNRQSQGAASSRGQKSRSSSRSGGGGRRR
jgi:hypothetical protein